LNHYKEEDHQRLADELNRNLGSAWLLTYDNKKAIRSLYPKEQTINFSLNYSAHKSRKGREILVFSKALKIQ